LYSKRFRNKNCPRAERCRCAGDSGGDGEIYAYIPRVGRNREREQFVPLQGDSRKFGGARIVGQARYPELAVYGRGRRTFSRGVGGADRGFGSGRPRAVSGAAVTYASGASDRRSGYF